MAAALAVKKDGRGKEGIRRRVVKSIVGGIRSLKAMNVYIRPRGGSGTPYANPRG